MAVVVAQVVWMIPIKVSTSHFYDSDVYIRLLQGVWFIPHSFTQEEFCNALFPDFKFWNPNAPNSVLKSGDFNASYKFWWFQRLLNCTIIIIKVRFWRFFTDVFVVAFWWSVMFWWLINDRASSWVLASFATTLLLKLLHPHHVTVCALILFLFER